MIGAVQENGFYITHENNNIRSIYIESSRVESCIEYAIDKGIQQVIISSFHKYEINNIDFIENYTNFIDGITIQGKFISLSPLRKLKKVKYLRINDSYGEEIDLSDFPNINYLVIPWNKNIKNLSKCINLKSLFLWNYNPKSKNLEELNALQALKEISIIKSNVNTLKGLEGLAKLQTVILHYFPKLEFLDFLKPSMNNLTHLEFSNCKRLTNFNYVKDFKKIEVLKFMSCPDIPTIKFVKEMPQLKSFIFLDTNVNDGDMRPLLNLEYVGYTDKKNFNLKSWEVNNKIKERNESK